MSNKLEQLAAAVTAAGDRTPGDVVEAFLPELPLVFGIRLRPFTLGSYLCLQRLHHPFVIGNAEVTVHDLAAALYVLSTDSKDVFAAISDGSIGDRILETADRASLADIDEGVATLQAHIERSLSKSVPMESPNGAGQKKTAASDGG